VIPTPEDVRLVVPDPANPRFSYSGGKLAGELITRNYLRGGATGAIIFRPHNVYGPAMGFEHVVPNLVHKIRDAARHAGAAGAKLEIELQGSGRETRAFCYVDDAAEAIALLEEKGAPGATYHVGVEEEIAIADLARRLGKLRGLDVAPRPGPAPAGAPVRRCADTRKLRALGFAARTSLDAGLERTLAWYWDHDDPAGNPPKPPSAGRA
jgi:nucleoside-diphosphate-sugar epimerase